MVTLAALLMLAGALFTLPGAEHIPVYWSPMPASPGTLAVYCEPKAFPNSTHVFLCDGMPDRSVLVNSDLFAATVDEWMGMLPESRRTPAQREQYDAELMRYILAHEWLHYACGEDRSQRDEYHRHREPAAFEFGQSARGNAPRWNLLDECPSGRKGKR